LSQGVNAEGIFCEGEKIKKKMIPREAEVNLPGDLLKRKGYQLPLIIPLPSL
jgi:hypothetical protein